MERIKLTPSRDEHGLLTNVRYYESPHGHIYHISFTAHDSSNEKYRVCVDTKQDATEVDLYEWYKSHVCDVSWMEFVEHCNEDDSFVTTYYDKLFRDSLISVVREDGTHLNPDDVILEE